MAVSVVFPFFACLVVACSCGSVSLILAGDYYFLSLREVDFAWQMPWFYCT